MTVIISNIMKNIFLTYAAVTTVAIGVSWLLRSGGVRDVSFVAWLLVLFTLSLPMVYYRRFSGSVRACAICFCMMLSLFVVITIAYTHGVFMPIQGFQDIAFMIFYLPVFMLIALFELVVIYYQKKKSV